MRTPLLRISCLVISIAASARAATFSFSTGSPSGVIIATASRPGGASLIDIETADDFILPSRTVINQATFTGLLTSGGPSSVNEVRVEIYRVFPLDSANPPSGHVPTRVNSPGDIASDSRDSIAGGVTFSATLLAASFAAANSVINGINPIPNQTTGGEGGVTAEEVLFSLTFTPAFVLPPGHYFFVPQVGVSTGNFLWLSAPRPAFTGDLQTWIRNANLDPDWLRVGTDIIGGTAPPTVNGAFSLAGFTAPRADFNGDGKEDILWRNYTTGQNALWLMNGTAFSSIVDLPALPNVNYRIEGTADFNNDGQPDIVLRNYSTGQDAVWLMNGTTISSIVDLPALPNTDYHIEGTGDFNGDQMPDIILRNYVTGQDAVWLMNGTAVSTIVDLPALSNPAYRIESCGDFNGDGKPDIVLRNYTTGQNALWLMNGTTLLSVVDLPLLANTAYRIDAIGDFNADGQPDIVLRNDTTGQNAVWIMSGTSVSAVVDLPALPNTAYEINGPR